MSWVSTTVGEFAPFLYGKGLPQKDRCNGPVKVFGSNGPVGEHDTSLIDEPGVIIGRKGSVGEVHYAPEPFWPIDTTFYVVSDDGRDIRFTYYLLKHLGLQRLSGDSAIPGLNRDAAHSTTVRVPELRNQRTIAAVLGSIDDLIENNRRRIEVLEEMARLLYREWFVHFRFPGHEGVELVDSELGPIPKGWTASRLGNIAAEVRRSTKRSAETIAMPYVPIDSIHPKSLTLRQSKPGAEAASSLRLFDEGDVLFGAMRAYFHKVCIAPFAGVTRSTCFVLRPDPGRPLFAAYALSQAKTVNYAAAHSTGSTIPYTKWESVLSEMPLVLPSTEPSANFERAVKPLVQMAQRLVPQNAHLVALRNLLLPKLVSGEIDVSELDLDALIAAPS